VETTGLIPGTHDIIEIAIVPLNKFIEPYKHYKPFVMLLKPKRFENWEGGAENVNGLTKAEVMLRGYDPWKAADMIEEWFDRLELGPQKQLIPLAHNWPFDREFIKEWLGPKTFEYIFSGHFRDTMSMALFHNDRMFHKSENYEFAKVGLKAVCNRLNVDNKMSHRALYDCLATAECYKKLCTDVLY
jgi:DNA polymerase III epsilon subunit-like protein